MDLKNLDPEKAFLGVGWAFPPALDVTRVPAMVAYEEDIRQSIMIIMGTEPGERIMRPDFGAGLNRFVFEPANTTTMALIQTRVRGALVARPRQTGDRDGGLAILRRRRRHRGGGLAPARADADAEDRMDQARRAGGSLRHDERGRALAHRHHGENGGR